MTTKILRRIGVFGRRLIVGLPENESHLNVVFLSRALFIFGLLLVWIFISDVLDPVPTLEEANRMEGILVDAIPGSRSNRIIVEGEMDTLRARSFAGKEIGETLAQNEGKQIIVWYYRKPRFVIPEIVFVEVMIDGQPILGNWEEVRTRIKRPWKLYMVAIGLLIMAQSIYGILKLTTKKEENDGGT